MQLGTKVLRPCKRHGSGYTQCNMCGLYYTSLGISRHWSRCPKREKKAQDAQF
jgi:hypothetical protein